MKRLGPRPIFAVLAVATACALVGLTTGGAGAAPPTSFAAGSLIIPMDTDATGNHAAFNQNQGMWKSYGLLFRLLQNGIPVRWAILEGKTGTTDVDFSVANVRDRRTTTALGAWSYRGGPFIIDSADAARAMPIIAAWWAANGNQPNVHEALSGFSANVNVTLRSAPRIANEAINAGISIAYYNAAGIPDLNGRPWSLTSPNILDQTEIAAGGLFEQGSVCLRRKFDVFVTPHNSGYAYSLSDPTNLGTRTYAQFDAFVQQGGGWTALCHSILSNENATVDLTRNGSNAVKALFKTSLPGGKPGGFLTTTGFPTIDNGGGTWTVPPGAADLPVAQNVPPAVAPGLPGGSVQTWPSPGNPGAPTYWPNTERVGFFDTAGVDHDHIISGTYHDGTGLGKLTYIGGHSLSTSLPYSANGNGPYLRAFYNSLFFNGSAVAKLDLTFSPSTYPQNGAGLLTVDLANTGGSVATSVGNVSVTLAPGFTYAGTTAGPVPDVSVDGRTLTWIGGLGDIAGGATAVRFRVAVAASVSSTTGVKNVGQLHATYGDIFGEAFTADVCRDITVTPTPAPKLTKTPTQQGPVKTGSTVTWTMSYGNTGSAALLGTTLQDALPPGFTYVSSSSTPNLGSPTVIPAASGTIVRWNVGTIAANTPNAGTVTITARAGPVTSGSGTPPGQTFTNKATLAGKDAGGNAFSATASADVDVQALDITLDKTVDKAFLTPLPGQVTYTLRPRSDNSDVLEGVRVIDPLPAGVTSPPVSVGQNGTFGAYTPIAAQPGNDPGPPVLDTAMSVNTNVVAQGASVNVTLNVKSSTAVTGVSPTDIGIAGGNATCTGPTPASANVPAGGAGVNFAWSCTLNDLGEYVFSAGADDAAATTDWPTASSASVLSTAGGGPNVVTWNLGSSTAAVGGSTITSGYTPGVYGLRGNNGGGTGPMTFQKFDLETNSWGAKANTLQNVAKGGALTVDSSTGTIYQLQGDGKQGFNAYSIAGNSWTARANTGTNVGEGGALLYLPSGGTKYVYALMGGGTKTFKRYDVAANTWTQLADTPANVQKGGSLTTDGTNIYAFRGAGQKDFWRYNVATNTWTALASNPDNINWGGGLARVGNFIYATIGGGKNRFYRYDIGANTWTLMANTPANVADGGSLTTDGTFVYAFQGKTTGFWRYNIATNQWTTLAPFTANTGQGGALVFDPGVNPQGRFSAMTASRSLAVTGDTETVTLRLASTNPANNVVPGTLTVSPTAGASCSTLTGPVLTSPDNNISGTGDAVTYEWTCTVAAGTNPGSLVFSNTASANGGLVFAAATSNSVIVTSPLTYTVNVPIGAPNPVVNLGLLSANGQTAASPQVSTATGPPVLTIVKSNAPGQGATVQPGDPITYSMTVENSGTGTATGVVVTDPVPANSDFVTCSGGNSCNQAAGTVSWTLGTLLPGDKVTVSFTVTAQSSLAISSTPYTISNTGTVDSDQTNPVPSNTVTNQVEVQPQIVKTVSASEAAPGDTLTYTLTVSNPGASFTGDVTDSVPAGTTFSAGSCSPACSFAAGTVTWGNRTIPHGTTTFSFNVTVNPATGGTTVTNSGTLDPASPNLPPIPSNPVETEIGPNLAIVKSNNPTGQVQNGSQIAYSLFVTNESNVTAQNTVVTDPVPVGTSFGTCSTPVGTCGQGGGVVTFNLGDVPARATITVSFTVTVGTPPVGTLEIPNQAQATTTGSPETAFSNPVVNPLPFPDLLLSKRADPITYDAVGDVVTYSYIVANNSTTSTLAGPVTVTDNKTTVTCPPGDLAPLASLTCHATYTVTQADLNAGQVTNTATAHGGGIDSNADAATVTAIQSPALSMTKAATETTYSAVGDVLHYSYTVRNTGNVSLAGPVTVTDDKSINESCPAVTTVGNNNALLDPGETIACTATYTVTQADLDGGSVTNHATAHAAGTDSNQDAATVVASPLPHVTLTKQAGLDVAQVLPVTRPDVGDKINYTLTAVNDGNVTLTNVTITDPALGALGCTPSQPATLAPGASLLCTAAHTLTQADINAGKVDNTALVTGKDPSNANVGGTDKVSLPLDQQPRLTLSKQPVLLRTIAGSPNRVDPGDRINYTLTAVNAGNVTLTNVAITDPALGALNCTPPQPTTLAPGASLVCTGSHTITQADLDAGEVDNTATVTGTDPKGGAVSRSDSASVVVAQQPHLKLTKQATLDMTQVAPSTRADVGDKINYTLTAVNDGNVTLTNVAITDPSLTLNCAPPQLSTLAPGATLVCTGTRTLTQADINTGHRDNTATVAGVDPKGNPVGDTDTASVPIAQLPRLTLVKQATENSYNAVGNVLHYSYTVKNTGNVSLAGPVTVTDDKSTNESCPAVTTVGNNDANLDPGETIVCSATYTITQADLNTGSVTNTASAHAAGTDSNQDQVRVSAVPEPTLTLTKSATEISYGAVGDVLHYSYTVKNTGNVSLAGPVTVTDDKSTNESCPAVTTVGNHDSNLDPGETIVCTATYTVTQADLNSGSVTNTATAHAAGTNSNQGQAIVDAAQQPHLTLTKQGTLDETQVAPADRVDPGDVINYTLTAVNDGNVTLTNVAISDPSLTLNCAPLQPATLAPGGTLVCTATRPVTQPDINTGRVDNTATVGGTDPKGQPVADSDHATVFLDQEPHLTLTKDATLDMTQAGPPDRADAGDKINYTLTAVNDGNVPLTNVAIADPSIGALNCAPLQPVTLAPNGTLTCTATYTLTQSDIDSGRRDNTALVAGKDPTNKTVGDTDQASVPLASLAHLTLVKQGVLDKTVVNPSGRVDVGDVINYTLTATNDGNVTLSGVAISDPSLPALNCTPPQPTAIAPGATLVCTGTYVLTQDDIDAGAVDNTATAAATDPKGNAVGDTDNVDVPLAQGPHLVLTKQATLDMTQVAPATRPDAGDVINYTLTAINDGNVKLNGVTISDPSLGTLNCAPPQPAELKPNGELVCTATRTLTQADIEAGEADNTATVVGTDPKNNQVGDSDNASVPLAHAPELTLTKSAGETSYDAVGDVLTYTYTVTNTGNVALADPVFVDDNRSGDESCPSVTGVGNNDTLLDPGETVTCSATYTVTQADLDAGFVTNTATATAAGTTSNQANATVEAEQTPQLILTKQAALDETIVAPADRPDPGDKITYTLTAVNAGDVTLTGVAITDPSLGALNCTPPQPLTLAPGDTLACTATRTLTQADINTGNVANTATVDGNDPNGGQVGDSDTANVALAHVPHLTLTKQATLDIAKVAPATRPDVGDEIDYKLTAVNDGNVPLTAVAITDPTVGALNCTPPQPTTLAPGATLTCTATYTLTQADLNRGHVANRATVAGTDLNNNPVGAAAVANVPLDEEPHLTLTKDATLDMTQVAPATRADAGDKINYTLTAVNDGNITLTNVTITDPSLGVLNCAPLQPTTLAPGETLVCTGTRTLTQADIDAGHADNTAMVSGDDSSGDPVAGSDSAEVPLGEEAHLHLTKQATLDMTQVAPASRADPGDVINYTLTAVNDGNVTLTNVTISDPSIALNCAPLQPTTLAPGGVLVCTGTRTLTQADIDAGKVDNTATVTGTDTNNHQVADTDNATVPPGQEPRLTLVKHAAETSYSAVGDVLHYSYTVRNTGNTTLAGPVTVTDDKSTDESCPAVTTVGNGDTNLDPGETIVCTATYTIKQPDLNAGFVVNTADAHADGIDSNQDQVLVFATQAPDLTLVKDTSDVDYDAVGDVLHYTYTVRNSGNTTLAGPVTVTDDRSTDESCPALTTVGDGDTNLDPGETIVCTATYTVTQADLNAGSVTNTATAHAGGTNSNQAQVIVDARQQPHLTLTKQATLDRTQVAPPTRADAGDVINYTLTVVNDGNVTLTNVAISDPSIGVLNCAPLQPTTLAPGGTLVCTATRPLTQADIDTGRANNTATVAGTDPNGDPVGDSDGETVPLAQLPHLTLSKQATLDKTQVAPATRADAGDKINYTLTAVNDGNVTLTNVTISDPSLGVLNCAPPQPVTLAPNATLVCTGSQPLTQADIDAGKADNSAVVTGTDTNNRQISDPADVSVPLGQEPDVTLTKQATLDMTLVAPPDRADAGDAIDYTLTAVNNGNVTLTNVAITDPSLGALGCTPPQPATLAPGAALVCTGSRTLTQVDINTGHADNTATVDSDDPKGHSIGATADASVPLGQKAHLDLTKQATLDMTQAGLPTRADAGDVINYTLTAVNDGNVPLTDVAISDPSLTLTCAPVPPLQPPTLAPGAKLVCTATYTLTQSDIDSGHHDNTATAAGTDPNNDQVGDSDSVHQPLAQVPRLTLKKDATLDMTPVAPGTRPDAGDKVNYTLTAVNTGNVTLTGVAISDPAVGALSCAPSQPATLAPGATLVCTATRTLTQADINAAEVDNSATVSGDDPNGDPVGDSDDANVPLAHDPKLVLTKAAAETDYDAVGDVLHYTYTVKNTGNVSLAGPVTVTDNRSTDESCPALTTVGNNDTNFDPAETIVCTATYTVTQADLDAGSVTNFARANAGGTASNVAQATVDGAQQPHLTLTKQALLDTTKVPPADRADPGDRINYRLRAVNDGNVTLTNVAITDPSLGALNCMPLQPTALAPGATLECAAAHTLTQADINAGQVTNTATVAGNDPNGGPVGDSDTANVGAPQLPHLTLTKQATLDMTQVAPSTRADVGDKISYTLTAVNDGNVPLTAVAISDPTVGALNCTPPQPAALAPGATLTCTATYTLTQADINNGKRDNAATVTGTDTNNNPVGGQAVASVPLAAEPHVTLTKQATLDMAQVAPATRPDPGDKINYTLTAVNDGNVPLTGVAIADASIGLNCAPLQPATLAPGATLVCTGTRTLTQADIDAGKRENTATVSGNDPHGTPVDDSDNASVPLGQVPHLSLTKQATLDMTQVAPATRPDPGDKINYTLTAVNDGNVTLTNVTITDPSIALNCAPLQPTTLVPGGVLVCTGTRTLTQADIDAGKRDNTAAAAGTDTNNKQVGDSDSATVPLAHVPRLTLVKDATETSYSAVGDVLHYSYTVKNTGNTTLAGPVTVTDDKSTDESCPALTTVGNNDGSFDPGETIVCTATYTITQSDLNAGSVTNTASAHADGTDSNQDQVTVLAVQTPKLTLTKAALETEYDSVGDVLHYSYAVKNTGNTTLAGPVTVTDDRSTDESCPALTTVGNNDGSFDPGETIVCTATYTVTQADLNAGSVTNTATAHAAGTNSNQAQVIVDGAQQPHLTLTKQGTLDMTQVAPATGADPGDKINYTLTVVNDGNVTLTNVAIADPSIGLNCAPPQPTTLLPGATLVCTATYTLTQADIDAGKHDNSATVAGTDPNDAPVGDADGASVAIGRLPHLTLTKQATLDKTQVAPATRADAGDKIDYKLTAVNDGNVTLTNVAISDPSLGVLNCAPPQPVTLAPKATLVCAGTRTLTQADIDAGKRDNTAAVAGKDPNDNTVGDTDNASVPLGRAPHLALTKAATLDMTQVAPPSRADVGDVITYKLTAVNDGNVTLTNVAITDPSLGALICTPLQPAALAPGATLVCNGSRTLTQTDIDTGHADNIALIAGTDPIGDPVSGSDSASVPLGRESHLTLTKQATLDMTQVGPATRADAGDKIDYKLTAVNDGNVPLTAVAITDPSVGALNCTPQQPATLAPGATLTCTATYTLTQADINNGKRDNAATVTGTDADNNQASASANATVPLAQLPRLNLVKHATETTYNAVGNVLHYSYTVTNTGNVSLTGPVTVTDDKSTDESCPAVTTVGNSDANLDPGETIVCSATYTITQNDLNIGSVTNTASAHAAGTDSNPDQVTVAAIQSPQVQLTKSSNATPTTTVGDTVTYSFKVTNTGGVTITGYTVSDPLPGLSAIDCAGQPAQLAPGASATCTAIYTVTQADLAAGKIVNTATVNGTTATAGPVQDLGGLTINLTQLGTLQIVKRLVPSTDQGRFDLNIDGGPPAATAVGDGGQTPAVPVSATTTHSVSETPAPGTSSDDYTAETTCTRDGNPIVNLDPANITVGVGQQVVCTITNTVKPTGLAIEKSAPAVAHDGDTIVYGIAVRNTGAAALVNVNIADTIGETGNSCLGGPIFTSGDGNGNGRLDPGEIWNYTCEYVVQHDDENATQHIVNVATVTALSQSGHPAGPVDASATTLITHPAISLLKTAPATARAGSLIPYRLVVTNTGDTSFDASDVKVTDPQCTARPRLITKGGDRSPATLDPGDRWTFGCSVQTKSGERSIQNRATVDATDVHVTSVNAGDSADTQLIEGEQSSGGGRAKLTGRTGCVYKSFSATVRGRQIARVIFRLNGKVVKRVTNRKDARVIRFRVDTARLRAGNHRITARVTFTRASGTKAKTLRLSFKICPQQVVSPRFTG